MADRNPASKNLLMYIGIALLLAGATAATGEDMGLILFGGMAILTLEVAEFKPLSYKSGVLAQIILSSALLFVGIIKLVESIGKNFAPQHLYLTMMLVGLILILIDSLKRYPGIPEG